MNNERRKNIERALTLVESAWVLLEEAKGEFETARDDEQDYHDNMPESLQCGERGDKAEAAISCLSEICDAMETIGSEIEAIRSNCEIASE